jgi:hypothetical protein
MPEKSVPGSRCRAARSTSVNLHSSGGLGALVGKSPIQFYFTSAFIWHLWTRSLETSGRQKSGLLVALALIGSGQICFGLVGSGGVLRQDGPELCGFPDVGVAATVRFRSFEATIHASFVRSAAAQTTTERRASVELWLSFCKQRLAEI